MTARTQLEALLRTIATLEQKHRAGENEAFGELEDLFGFARDVRTALDCGAALEPPAIATPAPPLGVTVAGATTSVEMPARSAALPERAGVARIVVELPAGARAVLENGAVFERLAS